MVGRTSVLDLADIVSALGSDISCHARNSPQYQLLERTWLERVSAVKNSHIESVRAILSDDVEVTLEYVDFGRGGIDTFSLFGLDELIVFLLYSARSDVSRSVDVGANIGFHSILMAKTGWQVDAYEPDPVHLGLLENHLKLNGVDSSVTFFGEAVSDYDGSGSFTRVVDNSTGSHLTGSKTNPYGELDVFDVTVKNIVRCLEDHRFLKLDAEGAEARIVGGMKGLNWENLDVVLEVGSAANGELILSTIGACDLKAYSQKTGWSLVRGIGDVPMSYKEGSLFISGGGREPWGRRVIGS